MASQKFNPDSFGTFLEGMNKYESNSMASKGSDGQEILLARLSTVSQMTVPELIKDSGLRVSEFKDSLNSLEELGLVKLDGEKGRNVVQLTDNGRKVAETLS